MIVVAGRQFIKQTLRSSLGPSPEASSSSSSSSEIATPSSLTLPQAFETIQSRCGLEGVFPRMTPSLHFIDTLHCQRSSLYKTILSALMSEIETTCASMNEAQLIQMLKECIKFIVVIELRPIPIYIINKLNRIPLRVLDLLEEKGVLAEMPLRVRQQAWKYKKELFWNELGVIFGKESSSLVEIVTELIGKEEDLFSQFADYCITNGIGKGNYSVCSVFRKVLILMKETSCRIASLGKVHEFASHIELILTSQGSGKEDIESEIIKRLQAVIQSEMALKEKELLIQKKEPQPAVVKKGKSVAPAAVKAPLVPPSTTSSSSQPLQYAQISLSDLEEAWQFLTKCDEGGIFARPVTDAVAPGYSKRIKKPMDLQTIHAKLPEYPNFAALDADVRLMFRNCKDFNGAESFFGQVLVLRKLKTIFCSDKGDYLFI